MVVHVADKNFFFKNDDSFGKMKFPVAISIAAEFAQKLASHRVEDLNAMVVRVTDKHLFSTRSDTSGFIKLPITFPKAAPSPDKLTGRRAENLDAMVVRVADKNLFPKNGDIMGKLELPRRRKGFFFWWWWSRRANSRGWTRHDEKGKKYELFQMLLATKIKKNELTFKKMTS